MGSLIRNLCRRWPVKYGILKKDFICSTAVLQCSPLAKQLQLDTKYNILQVSSILKKINKCSVNDLVNMSFDFFEAEEMKKYRKENGPFRKLSDLLKVPAISEEKIETFCSLVAEKIREKNTSFRGVISPHFPDLKEELSNVVGVMVSADCSISWAEITKDYRLDNWGQVPMFSGQKKLAPHEIHEAVSSAVKEIPQSRVYVFESIPNLSPQQSYIQPYIERKETHAMLLALLNAREPVGNKVFYLRSKLPTRLFKIMVGNERISSRPLVTRLLQGECVGENDPCRLTDLNPETFDAFSKLPGVQQEAYSNALILAMSFLKLIPIEMSDKRSGDE